MLFVLSNLYMNNVSNDIARIHYQTAHSIQTPLNLGGVGGRVILENCQTGGGEEKIEISEGRLTGSRGM